MDDIWFEGKSGMSVDIVKGMTVVRANPAGNCKEVSEQLLENARSFLRKLSTDTYIYIKYLQTAYRQCLKNLQTFFFVLERSTQRV